MIGFFFVVADVSAINGGGIFKRRRGVLPAIEMNVSVAGHVYGVADLGRERAVNIRRRFAVLRTLARFGGVNHVMARGEVLRLLRQYDLQQRDAFDRARARRAVAFITRHQGQREKEFGFVIVGVKGYDLAHALGVIVTAAQRIIVLHERAFAFVTSFDSGEIKLFAFGDLGREFLAAFDRGIAARVVDATHRNAPLRHRAFGVELRGALERTIRFVKPKRMQ